MHSWHHRFTTCEYDVAGVWRLRPTDVHCAWVNGRANGDDMADTADMAEV
jgi:hypothetical protein